MRTKRTNRRGFTLVELVVGIVVLAVAMMIMNTMLISQSKDALEPLYRLRASQLGQSIMQDILSRAYDENSDHNGGKYRCGEIWINGDYWFDVTSGDWLLTMPQQIVPCTDVDAYGVDNEENRIDNTLTYRDVNDVDDFITDGFQPAVDYGDVLGAELSSQYNNYAVSIEVEIFNSTSKKIAVIIQTPSKELIRFSALKGNY